MVLKSYAKINLSLSVNKKFGSGLHNIQSFYCLVNLHDNIFVKKIKNKNFDKISFIGPFSIEINQSNNSVKKVLDVMRKNKLIFDYYEIRVYKKIPVFSGFGGGTSNAAFLLKYLTKRKIKKKLFDKIVNRVGSDLRLFFNNQGYQNNLKSVIKLKKKHRFYFLLVFPKIKSSTKNVYSSVKRYSKLKTPLKQNFTSSKKLIDYLLNSKNDLQSIVEKKHSRIRTLLINISKLKGCHFSRMTGSGSACYGLFDDENCSKVALKKLRKKYPKFWISIAKTI